MSTIDAHTLALAVKSMRDAQNRFFRAQGFARREILNESKRLERQVDKMCDAVLSPQQDMLQEDRA